MNSREYEQLNMIIMLSEEQEKTFNKYGFIYESEDLKNRVNTQKYMYSVLKNKKMDNTSVEKLFDLLETDIKLQYEMKAHMENKSGFLIALWGVLLGVVLQCDLLKIVEGISLIKIGIISILVITGILTLYYLVQVILSKNYFRYTFDERELNDRCAVEDKDMFMVMIIEAYSNICEKNEKTNNQKAEYLSKALKYLCAYIFDIVLFFLF